MKKGTAHAIVQTAHAIVTMVEAILSPFTEDKLLHIVLNVDYLCHYNQDDERYASIDKSFDMHYIFYRPGDVTTILRCSKKRYPFIENSDVFHMISDCESSSCDDWSSRLEGDINMTNQKIIKKIISEYEKIAGRKMPEIEELAQPSFVQIRSAKLLNGIIDGHDNNFRDYRVELTFGNTNFIQIKD